MELDFPDDVGDAGLAGLAGGEVPCLLGLPRAGPVRAVAGEEAGNEDLQQERGQGEVGLVRGESRDGVRRGGQGVREADLARGMPMAWPDVSVEACSAIPRLLRAMKWYCPSYARHRSSSDQLFSS